MVSLYESASQMEHGMGTRRLVKVNKHARPRPDVVKNANIKDEILCKCWHISILTNRNAFSGEAF